MSRQKVEVARSMSCGHELEGTMQDKFDGIVPACGRFSIVSLFV